MGPYEDPIAQPRTANGIPTFEIGTGDAYLYGRKDQRGPLKIESHANHRALPAI
jgi:hypothetical protein